MTGKPPLPFTELGIYWKALIRGHGQEVSFKYVAFGMTISYMIIGYMSPKYIPKIGTIGQHLQVIKTQHF